MAENFDSYSAGLNAPAGDAFEIDLSSADVEINCTRAVYIGTSGDVKVQLRSGAVVTFRNAVGGCERPWRVKKIFKVGTTAGGIVTLW